uniref:Abnormal cell migration protein 18-like fibronectin type I domain-containing protein n=1 Tax=Haemonchus contortus TaxID=6289 RepID=A0A7I4YCZ8_HAECO
MISIQLHVILQIIFIVASSAAVATFDRNASHPYIVKKTWVENFVRFQYVFERKGAKTKIIPLGCVPTNRDDGALLEVGERFIGTDFVFACEESEDGVISYDAVACVDMLGKEMMLGEMRKLANGTVVLHCNIYGGALKKVVERAAGCFFNETVYGEDEMWIEPLINGKRMRKSKIQKKVSSNGNNSRLTGRLMECFRPHHSYYESHVIGCAIGRIGVRFEEFVELDRGVFAQCEQDDTGNVRLRPVQLDDLSCTYNNQTYAHLSTWTDNERAARMTCSYGSPQKTGCSFNGSTFDIGQELPLSNGCTFLCHPQSNVYVCDQRLGNWTVDDRRALQRTSRKGFSI